MDENFWLQKWQTNQIAFHKSEANPALVQHFSALALNQGSRIFVPLCGKTLDIGWLRSQGYRVAGAELAELAVTQLFDELGVAPTVSVAGETQRYSAEGIDIFVGDIFDVSAELLGPVDGVYDRAALVALPKDVRDRYTAHLIEITGGAPQLLVTFEYDPAVMTGPPFSITGEEVKRHYSGSYEVSRLASAAIPGGLKGKYAANQSVWRLTMGQHR
ncbi:MAG: thiopurine S-methyltransferase [Cyanobacteria bacterium P01_A01_bin.135]